MNATLQKTLAALTMVTAILLMIIGAGRSVKVYERDTDAFGVDAFQRISDRQLIIDATSTGVSREGAKLYSTYDRTQPRGKQACPS